MAFSIRLSEEERQLADSYAKLHSMSMGEAFKRALFDKIEEDYDITAAEEAYGEYQRSGKKSRPGCQRAPGELSAPGKGLINNTQ